jgi:hypothetical protein
MKIINQNLLVSSVFALLATACGGQANSSSALNSINGTNANTSLISPNSSATTTATTATGSTSSTGGVTAAIVKPLALIYKGPGSCSLDQGDAGIHGYGCSEAAADVATAAGFQFKYVGPTDLPENATADQVTALFGNAKVWMQPGGIAETAFFAMTTKLRTEIVNFVSNGGGYVGFCAGAFMATGNIGDSRYAGFGIFPGYTSAYNYTTIKPDLTYTFESVTWEGAQRSIYFEGGPYLYDYGKDAEVMATFNDTGDTASARAAYGKGRVWISGPHPEAPQIWSQEDGITDPDGSDIALGADMVRWAGSLE